MNEPHDRGENFLQRWSQRKQAGDAGAREDGTLPDTARAEGGDAPTVAPAPSASTPTAFDPASLPPLASIGAATDIRPFLKPGVPEELKRAALRRAWLTDPAIRDFIGIAENQWDFTQADGVPGFGPLELTDELRRMASRLVGEAPTPAPSPGDSDRGPSDQGDEKPKELAQALTPRPASASAAGSGTAPAEPESFGEAAPHASPIGASQEVPDGGSQPRTAETVPNAAARRHGGAVPK